MNRYLTWNFLPCTCGDTIFCIIMQAEGQMWLVKQTGVFFVDRLFHSAFYEYQDSRLYTSAYYIAGFDTFRPLAVVFKNFIMIGRTA